MITACNAAIPYRERHFKTDGGFVLTWPFLNVPRGAGPYELLLDSNAASRTHEWIPQLPAEFARGNYSVNLWPALTEQWLSNEKFRANPAEKIEMMFLAPMKAGGLKFDDEFLDRQLRMLSAGQKTIKSQISLLFPYILIMRVLSRVHSSDVGRSMETLRNLFQHDIPRFSGCQLLAALTLELKIQQKRCLNDSEKPAYPLLESFFSNQPRKKNEALDFCDLAYLRNRAADLSIWYTSSVLVQHGYEFQGEPVVVTRDNALNSVILQALPPVVVPSGDVAFSIDISTVPNDLFEAVKSHITAGGRQAMSDQEKSHRLSNLYALAKNLSGDVREAASLDEAWDSWCRPDYRTE